MATLNKPNLSEDLTASIILFSDEYVFKAFDLGHNVSLRLLVHDEIEIHLFFQRVHPVGFLFLIIFDVVADDIFGDKDELNGVFGKLACSKQLVLHHTDLLSLFLVPVSHLVFGDTRVSV